MKPVMRSFLVLLLSIASAVAGAGGKPLLKELEVDSSQGARQRGAEITIGTCLMCHSLKYVKFGDLISIGMTQEQIEALLIDQGLDDPMNSLMTVEIREESYGKLPPDLSLITVARHNGPRYVYSLLTEYFYQENGETGNHIFPGIKMPDVLGYSDTATGSSERAAVEAQARDVVAFLAWAADPNAESRRTIGVYVIIYLIVLTALLYLLKKRTWQRLANKSQTD